MAKRIGLWLGPIGFLVLVLVAEHRALGSGSLLPGAVKVAAVAWIMAVWWVTEAIPIPVTSLLPLVLFPVLGIAPMKVTCLSYADHFILLLMGGFMVALGLEKWSLHRRIALSVILRVGTRPHQLVLGFMIAGAVLSMWISNTATTLMMLPIALAVLQRMEERAPGDARLKPMGVALLLGIAYACNVGGLGTPIGTPPNLIYMQQYAKFFPSQEPPSFLGWAGLAIPIVIVMVGVIWWLLTRGVNRVDPDLDVGDRDAIRGELSDMGLMSTPERRVLVVFVVTALLWITRRKMQIGELVFPGWAAALGLGSWVQDSTVAVAAAITMFIVPAGGRHERGTALLDWNTAVKIPWGLLLLFGGGLALAAGFQKTGLSQWVGHQLGGLSDLPSWAMIGVVCLCVTFLTEITSNTATTTILMPVLGSVCVEHGIDPGDLMLPAALSASCAFMLPVATAPNAIVFGTGRVRMADMVRCGIWINLIGVVVITAWLLVV